MPNSKKNYITHKQEAVSDQMQVHHSFQDMVKAKEWVIQMYTHLYTFGDDLHQMQIYHAPKLSLTPKQDGHSLTPHLWKAQNSEYGKKD